MRMAKVVQRDRRHSQPGDPPIEHLAEHVGMNTLTVGLRHDQIITKRFCSTTFTSSQVEPAAEHRHGPGVEIDASTARPRLHIRDRHLVSDRHHRLADRQPLRTKINVTPPQTQHLAPTHSGVGNKVEHRPEPVRPNVLQKQGELIGLPRPKVVPLRRAQRRSIGQRHDVSDHGALPRGIAERLVQHHMDVVHRLRCQPPRLAPIVAPSALVAIQQQAGVEHVDVFDSQLVERPPAERRDHVQLDASPIRLKSAGAQPGPLDRQPTSAEVVAERDLLAHHGLAAMASIHQLGQHLLRIAPTGPRRHPPSPILARRRIHAVVHHRVPTIALLLNASAHQRPLRINPIGDACQTQRPRPRDVHQGSGAAGITVRQLEPDDHAKSCVSTSETTLIGQARQPPTCPPVAPHPLASRSIPNRTVEIAVEDRPREPKRPSSNHSRRAIFWGFHWWRGRDLNPRPSGYEPDVRLLPWSRPVPSRIAGLGFRAFDVPVRVTADQPIPARGVEESVEVDRAHCGSASGRRLHRWHAVQQRGDRRSRRCSAR